MSPDDRGGDPRFDLSLRAALEAALLPHVEAIEAAGDPSLDAERFGPPNYGHPDPCFCDDCRDYAEDMVAIADAHHAAAVEHQEERALHGYDADPAAYDPCPFALMARAEGGVAEGRGRYAPVPRGERPRAQRPRFVPSAPRAQVWS